MITCLDTIELDEDYNRPSFDVSDNDDDDSTRRTYRSHIESLRDLLHPMVICFRCIEGVMETYHVPAAQQTWFQNFHTQFETFRSRLEADTVGMSSAQLETQIADTRRIFTELFLDYFAIKLVEIDLSHDIAFNTHQLNIAIASFASWVVVDIETLKTTCDEVKQSVDKEIALALAIDHKEYWFSTYSYIYKPTVDTHLQKLNI